MEFLKSSKSMNDVALFMIFREKYFFIYSYSIAF